MTTFDSVQFGFRLWCVNEKKKEKKNEESRFRWDTVFAYLVLSSILSCALTFLALTVERRGSEFDRTRRGRNETRRRETKIERAPVRAYEPCAKENECVREMRVGERKWKKGCRRKRGRKMKRECLLFCAKCHFSSRVGGCSFLFFFFFFRPIWNRVWNRVCYVCAFTNLTPDNFRVCWETMMFLPVGKPVSQVFFSCRNVSLGILVNRNEFMKMSKEMNE